MKKQAVLVVSFGTSHLDTLEKCISAVESTISDSMPEYEIRRAFTSNIIMKKLAARDGISIDDVTTALDRLKKDGFTKVVIQPTHVINGEEFDKLCRKAEAFKNEMDLSFGTPLLTTIEDYENTARNLMCELGAPAPDEAYVFMGHGTAHYANPAYAMFEYVLHDLGWKQVFVGTVEGYPQLQHVMKKLRSYPQIRHVRLQPLMIVAGDHATNDMSGPDDDSWCTVLEKQGYEVRCVISGLGEYASIRSLIAEHALETAKDFMDETTITD